MVFLKYSYVKKQRTICYTLKKFNWRTLRYEIVDVHWFNAQEPISEKRLSRWVNKIYPNTVYILRYDSR